MIEFHKIWTAQCEAARNIKDAFGVRPEAKDLRLRTVASSGESEGNRESARRVPAGGYVGPYPLRKPEAEGEDDGDGPESSGGRPGGWGLHG
jgi:hypothetical protein